MTEPLSTTRPVALFTDAYKPVMSGVVNSLELFRKGLEAVGQPALVFAPRFPGYVVEGEWDVRFPSVLLYKRAQLPFAVPASRRAWRRFKQEQPLLVHSQHPFWLGKTALGYARRADVPLVATIHTQYEQYVHYIPLPGATARRLVRGMVRRYCHQADQVITPSHSMAELLASQGIAESAQVIPNPLDLSAFRGELRGAEVRARYGLAADQIVFGFIGRMAREKNLETLLAAFDEVHRQLPESRLLLVGPGPYLPELRQFAGRLDSNQAIVFTDRVPFEEIAHYHAALDVFVMTSTTEVQPLVLPEAMAAGACLVAADAVGPRDVLINDNTGLLCEPTQEAFVTTMLKAGREPELRHRLGQAARQAAEEYDIPKATERLLTLYRNTLADYQKR